MERTIDELKQEVARLEQAIEVFKGRIEQALWLTTMLDRAKAPHPRFSVWEWEHKNLPTEAARRRVDRVLGTLYLRMTGEWKRDPESDRDIPGVPSDLLYIERPPTIHEIYQLVKSAAGFSTNAQVVELFHVIRGMYPALTHFVLTAADS